jgi:DNA-binding transcriptional ArsR family regulator
MNGVSGLSDTTVGAEHLAHASAPRMPDHQPLDAEWGLGEDSADLYARFFRALGDPTRVRLLSLLLDAPAGESNVGELVAAIHAPQGRVSTHLGCLRWCGLVQARREGKQVYYRVVDPRVRELLAVSGAVLRDHAAGVASCGLIR